MRETRTVEAAQDESARLRPRRTKAPAIIMSAALLGAYADIGQYAPGLLGSLPEAGTPWVLMAFFGGRLTRRPHSAAQARAGLILVGLSTYVALVHLVYGTSLYIITNDGRLSVALVRDRMLSTHRDVVVIKQERGLVEGDRPWQEFVAQVLVAVFVCCHDGALKSGGRLAEDEIH